MSDPDEMFARMRAKGYYPDENDEATPAMLARADRLAGTIGHGGLWHAGAGGMKGECIDGADVANLIRGLVKAIRAGQIAGHNPPPGV